MLWNGSNVWLQIFLFLVDTISFFINFFFLFLSRADSFRFISCLIKQRHLSCRWTCALFFSILLRQQRTVHSTFATSEIFFILCSKSHSQQWWSQCSSSPADLNTHKSRLNSLVQWAFLSLLFLWSNIFFSRTNWRTTWLRPMEANVHREAKQNYMYLSIKRDRKHLFVSLYFVCSIEFIWVKQHKWL